MVSAQTDGIAVEVESVYLESHSDPAEPRYVFAYHVSITNHGQTSATLLSRHWVIADARGKTEEVRGPGVIGETPRLEPGQTHRYQSFSVLKTPRGTMHGSYGMQRDDGTRFDAKIPEFILSTDTEASRRVLN